MIVVLGAALLVSALLQRTTPFVEESFQQLASTLSFTATPYTFLSLLPFTHWLPVIFGVLTLVLGLLLGKKYPKTAVLGAVVLCILSPLFVTSFTWNNPYAFIIFLNMLGLYLFSTKYRMWGVLPYLLLAWSGLVPFIGSMVLYWLVFEKKHISLHILPFIVFLLHQLFTFSLPLFLFSPSRIFSDFGSVIGIGIFGLVLVVVGLVKYWNMAKGKMLVIILLLFAALFIREATYFLLPVFSVLGGYGLAKLYRQKWVIPLLKNLTLFLLILGVVFSTISFQSRISDFPPSAKTVLGIQYLEGQEPGNVLTHYTRGSWISAYSQKEPVLSLQPKKEWKRVRGDVNALFSTYDLVGAKNILSSYNVSYILVDAEMKGGLVWDEEEQFLFLLEESAVFTTIYENENVTVYRYNE